MTNTTNGPRPVDGGSPPGDETVARLLQLAGHRPAIPEADAAMVKAAAHAEWQQVVWASRRKRIFLLRGAGGFLAAAAAVLLALNTNYTDSIRRSFTQPVAEVVSASGKAPGLEPAIQLWAGDVAETRIDDPKTQPRIALRLASDASVRLDAGTRLRLVSLSELRLENGAVFVDSQGASLEIQTAFGVISNVGTQFEVRLAPDNSSVRIRVREGEVSLEDGRGGAHRIRSGEGLLATADGAVERQTVTSCGPAWDWVRAVREPFAGATIGELLAWATREGGWTQGGTLAARVKSIEVHGGDIDDLSLEDVLKLWLPGSGLSFEIDECVLTVTPAN